MFKHKGELPKGIKPFIHSAAAAKRIIEEKVLEVFSRWGYQEIVTPALEYCDSLALGMGSNFQEYAYTLIDRESGHLMALRPDITPQIARIAATSLKDLPKPLRLCYADNVFRYIEPQLGCSRELFQAGVELIGLTSPEADVEMIAVAVESLKAIGLPDFRITVSQINFFRGLLEEMGLEGEDQEQVKEAIQKKDRSALEEILSRVSLTRAHREALLRFPFLFGREEVIEEARRLANNPVSLSALQNLAHVYSMLQVYKVEDFVMIDLAELRDLDYYTGIVFEGFTRELGYRICGGGRYDHLLGKYGASFPATGFALDIERAMLALERRGPWQGEKRVDFLVIDFQPDKNQALTLARNLRERGYRVARDIICRKLEDSLAYARSSHISHAIVLGLSHLTPEAALLKDIASGAEKVVEIKQILESSLSFDLKGTWQ